METSLIIILLIICCCCCLSSISSAGGLFYKPKFKSIGGGGNLLYLDKDEKKKLKINKLECSNDAFITEIYGKYDNDINYLGIKCSDNKSPKPIGIDIGSSFSNVSNDGYNKIIFKRDDVNRVRVRPAEDIGKKIEPKEESYVLKYMKLIPVNNKEKEFGTSDDSYKEDLALCRNYEKLTSISTVLNDSNKIAGVNEWGCGTDASNFNYLSNVFSNLRS